MSISVAGINLVDAVVNLEYELRRTQLILEQILQSNPDVKGPSREQLESIALLAVQSVQQKYPQAGIRRQP